MTVRRSWRSVRVTPAVAAAGLAAGAALGTGVLRIPCWFHALTGLDCPFCGGSRALGALLHGDVLAALSYNAFALVVLLPLAVVTLVDAARWEAGRARRWWPAGARGRWVTLVVVGLALVWWVGRNLPFAPFTGLSAYA
ncbi:DUF2752 domain-containing protein [Amycolatopsis thermalba]|uniref:DUF2752 domain-containing protein n=1 Tax=Amycolatopsis thermalba TaxID=944492 RepID=A0ABY4NTZ5_9PSEU|nr:DUF2752 domain-containing protein [Amycolatopsis thermalba]UQS23513.1 DUF2752 domain-containing protein [Amycolatopsis thermalba]